VHQWLRKETERPFSMQLSALKEAEINPKKILTPEKSRWLWNGHLEQRRI
jgi:hypothetical protein